MNSLLILFIATTLACASQATIDPADFADLFPLADAERILGEPAHSTEGAGTESGGVARYQGAFTANATDSASGKLGAYYYVLEQFPDITAAQVKYVTIKEANADHEGVRTLEGLGDEAYFHSDNTNFLFIMARKGKRVLTMKVNKLTSKTSREAFDEVAKQIVRKL